MATATLSSKGQITVLPKFARLWAWIPGIVSSSYR